MIFDKKYTTTTIIAALSIWMVITLAGCSEDRDLLGQGSSVGVFTISVEVPGRPVGAIVHLTRHQTGTKTKKNWSGCGTDTGPQRVGDRIE